MKNLDCIKVYRVLPDTFSHSELMYRIKNYEDICYYMGYTLFNGKIKHYPYYSSIQYLQKEESKYFFLFPEDALLCSSTLVSGDTCKIVEYNFPIDVATSIMGFGEYENEAIGYNEIIEIIIGKSYFTGNNTLLSNIDYSEKLEASLKSLKDTYQLIGEEYESIESLSDKLSQMVLFNRFAAANSSIVHSKEISGKVVTIFNGGRSHSNVNEDNVSLLNKNGILLDYSKEAKDSRYKVKRLVYTNKNEEMIEIIRDLKK